MRLPTPCRTLLALASLVALVALAACGGEGDGDPVDGTPDTGGMSSADAGSDDGDDGDDSDDGDDGSGGGDNGDGTDPIAATGPRFSYRTVPSDMSADAFVATADAQGAEGYRFQGPAGFAAGSAFQIRDVYVRDDSAPGRYTYRTRPDVDEVDALLAQMNAQGAEGYAFRGPVAFGAATGAPEAVSLYVRDESFPATFAYEALPIEGDGDTFLARANAQGERGYRYLSPLAVGTTLREFYVLETSSSGSFEYTVLPSPDSVDRLLIQANAQGTEGRVRRGEVFSDGFGVGQLRTLYVRDATASASIAYVALTPATSAEAFVEQATAQGAEGRLYVGDVSASSTVFDPDTIRSLYADVTGCDCTPLRLGDPFTY